MNEGNQSKRTELAIAPTYRIHTDVKSDVVLENTRDIKCIFKPFYSGRLYIFLLLNYQITAIEKNIAICFIKIIAHYKKIGHNINGLQQTACLVVNPITVDNFAFLFNCTPVGRTSDSMTVPTLRLIYG